MTPAELLLAISNGARGWLTAWARDFTDTHAGSAGGTRLNLPAGRGAMGAARTQPAFPGGVRDVGMIGALRKAPGKPAIG